MTFSINTNSAAMVALQSLTETNTDLQKAQEEVASGLKVSSALDDASTFTVAQGERATIAAYDAVNGSLSNATGLLSVANSAATAVSNLMSDVQSKLTSLSDGSLSTSQRTIYTADLSSQFSQINTYITAASYNGTNLLTTVTGVNFVSGVTGGTTTVAAEDLTSALSALAGSIPVSSNVTATIAETALASGGALGTFNGALATVLGTIGENNATVSYITTLNTDLQNAVSTGLGAQVDANLAQESAALTALQTKQQLGVQALSIANQAPSILLSLFH